MQRLRTIDAVEHRDEAPAIAAPALRAERGDPAAIPSTFRCRLGANGSRLLIMVARSVGRPTSAPIGLPPVVTANAPDSTLQPSAAAAAMPSSAGANLLRAAALGSVAGVEAFRRLDVPLGDVPVRSRGASSRRMSFEAVNSSTFSGWLARDVCRSCKCLDVARNVVSSG